MDSMRPVPTAGRVNGSETWSGIRASIVETAPEDALPISESNEKLGAPDHGRQAINLAQEQGHFQLEMTETES